jgi:ribose 5-phosphate isomerase A
MKMTDSDKPLDRLKRQAAIRAIAEVRDGMVLGLGSGSTAAFAVEALAARIAQGLQVVCIPTSEQTAALARRHGVVLTDFATHPVIDLTIDGADQVDRRDLTLIKGRGGALLREKIVAAASKRLVIIVDETKMCARLGDPVSLPIEVVPFGYERLIPRLQAGGLKPQLRQEQGKPVITDGGHYILDCRCGEIRDAAALELWLARQVGVVECGLFVGLASSVIVAGTLGVEIIGRLA